MTTKEYDNKSEAPIIDIRDFAKYQNQLSEIMEAVSDFSEEIHEGLFSLACADKWKEWSDSQPIGTVFDLSEEMLRNTGDKNIDLLFEILDKIAEVKEKIHVSQPVEKTEDYTSDEFDD